MRSIGIDIGSTYTKYCVMVDDAIKHLYMERTPVRQREYFKKKISEFTEKYPSYPIVSCGYGKKNIDAVKNVSELTALAVGLQRQIPDYSVALDIGGQDTKLILQADGKLKEFFVNDKCAAGSGLFLTNVLNILGIRFEDIDITSDTERSDINLSSVCAVFAQSEIIELLAENITPIEIIIATIRQILMQSSLLLHKCEHNGSVILSGGLTHIQGIGGFASDVLKTDIIIPENSHHLSAIGCAVIAQGLYTPSLEK